MDLSFTATKSIIANKGKTTSHENSGMEGVEEGKKVGDVVWVGVEFGEFDVWGVEDGEYDEPGVDDWPDVAVAVLVGEAVGEIGVPVIWMGTELRMLVK